MAQHFDIIGHRSNRDDVIVLAVLGVDVCAGLRQCRYKRLMRAVRRDQQRGPAKSITLFKVEPLTRQGGESRVYRSINKALANDAWREKKPLEDICYLVLETLVHPHQL